MVLNFAYGDGFAGFSNDSDPVALYLKGDQFTDGSVRMIPIERGASSKVDIEFRQRQSGVWNSTGIKVASASVLIGNDLTVSAGGKSVHTVDKFTADTSLLPHHSFTDAEGSEPSPTTPVLGRKLIRVLGPASDVSEKSGKVISFSITPSLGSVLITRAYYQTGTVAATAPIDYKVSRGTTDGGDVFFQKTLPTSLLGTPDTEFEIDYDAFIQTKVGFPVFVKFESENSFTLKAESPTGPLWSAADAHFVIEEDVLTESFVLSNDLGIVFDNAGNMARGNFALPVIPSPVAL